MHVRRGLLIILSSPSGAGKSTLSRRLLEWDPEISFSVSATTRAPRAGEVDGQHYHFMTKEAFQRDADRDEMLEYAEVFGNFYGSPKAPVEAAIGEGRDVLFDIDWQGAQQIQTGPLQSSVLSIFILPPSIAELRRRLETRDQDAAEVIAKRMQKSWDEISHWDSYDYVLINDDLDATEARLRKIIEAERLKASRQSHLSSHVRALQSEFQEAQP